MLKKTIKFLSSLLIRLSIFVFIAYIASMFGIAVAMGFDSGINTAAIVVLISYALIFLPALITTLLPLKIIEKPPLLLKAWFWMMITLIFIIGIIGFLSFFLLVFGIDLNNTLQQITF